MGNGLLTGLILTILGSIFTLLGSIASHEKDGSGKVRWTVWFPLIATLIATCYTAWQMAEDNKQEQEQRALFHKTLEHTNAIIDSLQVANENTRSAMEQQEWIADTTCKSFSLSLTKMEGISIELLRLYHRQERISARTDQLSRELGSVSANMIDVTTRIGEVSTVLSGTSTQLDGVLTHVERINYPIDSTTVLLELALGLPEHLQLQNICGTARDSARAEKYGIQCETVTTSPIAKANLRSLNTWNMPRNKDFTDYLEQLATHGYLDYLSVYFRDSVYAFSGGFGYASSQLRPSSCKIAGDSVYYRYYMDAGMNVGIDESVARSRSLFSMEGLTPDVSILTAPFAASKEVQAQETARFAGARITSLVFFINDEHQLWIPIEGAELKTMDVFMSFYLRPMNNVGQYLH